MLIRLNNETVNNKGNNKLLQKRLVTMERRVEYFESQSSRNNLIFHRLNEEGQGSDEMWEDCEKKVLRYLPDDQHIWIRDALKFERAHRLGSKGNQWLIVVKLLNYKDKDKTKTKICSLMTVSAIVRLIALKTH